MITIGTSKSFLSWKNAASRIASKKSISMPNCRNRRHRICERWIPIHEAFQAQAERSRWHRNQTIVSLFLTTFFLGLYFVRHPIFRFAAESWVVEDPLERADVLIVLSDDNFYADRATRAAELFREGKAPLVVASGRRLRPGAGIAELIEHDLVERGVPRDKILR